MITRASYDQLLNIFRDLPIGKDFIIEKTYSDSIAGELKWQFFVPHLVKSLQNL